MIHGAALSVMRSPCQDRPKFETPYPVLTIRQRHILTIAAVGRLALCPVAMRTALRYSAVV